MLSFSDAVDLQVSGAPKDVQKAMAETNRAGGDVETANEKVVEAKKVFSRAMGRCGRRGLFENLSISDPILL